jgi:hypothetical protein
VLREIVFANEANANIVNGNNTIDGDIWTGVDVGNANVFSLVNGSGLFFDANAANTIFTTATRSAARITIPLATLLPGFNPWWTLLVEVVHDSLTLGTSNNRTFFGVDPNNASAGSINRLLGGGRRNSATNQQTYGQFDATLNGLTNASSFLAFGMRLNARGVVAMSSAPAAYPNPYASAGASLACPDMAGCVFHPQAVFTIAFVTGEAGAAMQGTVQRIRFRGPV